MCRTNACLQIKRRNSLEQYLSHVHLVFFIIRGNGLVLRGAWAHWFQQCKNLIKNLAHLDVWRSVFFPLPLQRHKAQQGGSASFESHWELSTQPPFGPFQKSNLHFLIHLLSEFSLYVTVACWIPRSCVSRGRMNVLNTLMALFTFVTITVHPRPLWGTAVVRFDQGSGVLKSQ